MWERICKCVTWMILSASHMTDNLPAGESYLLHVGVPHRRDHVRLPAETLRVRNDRNTWIYRTLYTSLRRSAVWKYFKVPPRNRLCAFLFRLKRDVAFRAQRDGVTSSVGRSRSPTAATVVSGETPRSGFSPQTITSGPTSWGGSGCLVWSGSETNRVRFGRRKESSLELLLTVRDGFSFPTFSFTPSLSRSVRAEADRRVQPGPRVGFLSVHSEVCR